MDDEKSPTVVPFVRPDPSVLERQRTHPLKPPPAVEGQLSQPQGQQKLGLFPIGDRDVVISTDLLSVIVASLDVAPREHQQQLAAQLRASYRAPFI